MSLFQRFRFFLWYFGHFNVPLIGHLHPKLLALNDQLIVVKLPLRRRSRNHLYSMYFGALAVGADIAGGMHGFYHAKALGVKVSLVFKSFHAAFLKRPETDVYFICKEGEVIREMVKASQASGERVNKTVAIDAFTHYDNPNQCGEKVAEFQLEVSVKVLSPA